MILIRCIQHLLLQRPVRANAVNFDDDVKAAEAQRLLKWMLKNNCILPTASGS